jgi:hypothetical protein
LDKTVLVNKKAVSIHYILKNRDFIKIWKDSFWFKSRTKSVLHRRKRLQTKLVYNYICFPNIYRICFLEHNYVQSIKYNPIRHRFVKSSHIWQTLHRKKSYKFFLKVMFDFKKLDSYLQK